MTTATSELPQRSTAERHKHRVPPAPQHAHELRPEKPPPVPASDGWRTAPGSDRHGDGREGQARSLHCSATHTALPSAPLPTSLSRSCVRGGASFDGASNDGGRYGSHEKIIGDGVSAYHAPHHPQSDTEKQALNRCRTPSEAGNLTLSNRSGTIKSGVSDDSAETEDKVDRHLKKILVYLWVLSPFLTVLTSLYAFLAIAILVLSDPIRFCVSRKPLGNLIREALLPPIRLQLNMIHSFCPAAPQPPTLTLILISLASPLYAAAIAMASWVAAVFWFYAAILGEPNQSGQRDNDGRAAALGVRRWWEQWLQKAVGL